MFSQIPARITAHRCSNVLTHRTLHMTSIVRTEGAVAGSKGFGQKEKAVENQYARNQDVELLKSLKEKLAQQEKATADIQQKLSELESKTK